MNLNDPNEYKIIIFKISKYYTLPQPVSLREVFYTHTKDGEKPNAGIQEILLMKPDVYDKLVKKNHENVFERAKLREHASHSFTVRGYVNYRR